MENIGIKHKYILAEWLVRLAHLKPRWAWLETVDKVRTYFSNENIDIFIPSLINETAW